MDIRPKTSFLLGQKREKQVEPEGPTPMERALHRIKFIDSMMKDTDLYKFLYYAIDLDEFRSRIRETLEKFGLSDYAFFVLGERFRRDTVLSSLPGSLLDEYFRLDYHRVDVFFRHIEWSGRLSTPIFTSEWYPRIQALPFVTKETHSNGQISELYQSYGYNSGYIVPVETVIPRQGGLDVSDRMAALCVFDRSPDDDFRARVGRWKNSLELLAHIVDRVSAELYPDHYIAVEADCKVTPRPRTLLSILANDDVLLSQASEKMGISVKTANVHIAAAKKRLGVKTLYSAIAKGVRLGLIEDPNESVAPGGDIDSGIETGIDEHTDSI